LPHAADKAAKAAAPEATEAATTATRCMAGTPTYGYACPENGGSQFVRVEHVRVNEGGQAVVGTLAVGRSGAD
jgi:hypothetical protein